MSQTPGGRNRALDGLAETGQPWWRRYSSHGEFPWSTAISLAAHLLVVVLLVVFTRQLVSRDPLPPPIVPVTIKPGPDQTTASGEGGTDEAGADKAPVEDTMAEAKPEETPVPPDTKPMEKLDVKKPEKLEPFQPPILGASSAPEALPSDITAKIAKAKAALASPAARSPTGGAKAGGRGGEAETGRGGRQARWVLQIDASGIQDYLRQHDGIGSVIAFPARGDRWLYFSNASDPSRRTSEERDLSTESRFYWTNERQKTVADVCAFLGIPRACMMVMFLPPALEDRMSQMEQDYQNKREDEIAQTVFKVQRRGERCDVVVSSQTLR